METENTTNQIQKKKEGGFFTPILGLLSVFILFGALGGVAYYYFIFKQDSQAGLAESGRTQEVNKLIEQIKIKNGQIKILQEENTLLRQKASNTIHRLNYVIKPKAQFVSECYSAGVGKWTIPQQCMQNVNANVSALLKSDKRILVLEVIGIVDEKKYSGKNPELKQEGLASFRAKGIIEALRKEFPNIVIFEGLSIQKQQKRGFAVRAYYVE